MRANEIVVASPSSSARDPNEALKAVADQRARTRTKPATISTKPVSRDIALLLAEARRGVPRCAIDAESGPPVRRGPALLADHRDTPVRSPRTSSRSCATRATSRRTRSAAPASICSTRSTSAARTAGANRGATPFSARSRPSPDPAPARGDVVLTIDDRLQHILATELEAVFAADKSPRRRRGHGIPERGSSRWSRRPRTTTTCSSAASPEGARRPSTATGAPGADLRDGCRHPLVNKGGGGDLSARLDVQDGDRPVGAHRGTATRNTIVNVTSNVINVSGFNFYDCVPTGRWTSSTASRIRATSTSTRSPAARR